MLAPLGVVNVPSLSTRGCPWPRRLAGCAMLQAACGTAEGLPDPVLESGCLLPHFLYFRVSFWGDSYDGSSDTSVSRVLLETATLTSSVAASFTPR